MPINDLNNSHNSRIFVVSPDESKVILESFLSKAYKLFALDGETLNSKDDLLNKISQVMQFPDYFGNNWDALEECLNDLRWLPAAGYAIQFKHADDFVKCCRSDFETFLQIVETVARTWGISDKDFLLIIETHNPFLYKFVMEL